MKNKIWCSLLKVSSLLAVVLATVNIDSACAAWSHQEKVPQAAKVLSKRK